MRLIHCADLHLDSKMNTNLDGQRAKERQRELLHTYENMITYAKEHDVDVILIAGDLFDTENVAPLTKDVIQKSIRSNPDIHFYYLRGNHDAVHSLYDPNHIPENLFLFEDEWSYYQEGSVMIAGIELEAGREDKIKELDLEPLQFNIVLLHGQETRYDVKQNYKPNEVMINISSLKNRFIDYLALGHIHQYKREMLDVRGIYCYPGCLEGRGFDECGEHGFVVLDIDESVRSCRTEFVPFASRRFYTIPVNCEGVNSSDEISDRIEEALSVSDCDENAIVKLVLTGNVPLECEKNVQFLYYNFKDLFYYLKIQDDTGIQINEKDYLMQESLQGEFIRLVMDDNELSLEDKKMIIQYGLASLAGEEVYQE